MRVQFNQNQHGFTLIELLITMTIFASAMTAAINIFMYAQKSQRATLAKQATQTDARYALEVMAQQVRIGRIDYAVYGGSISSNPNTILALTNPSGEKIQFRHNVVGSRGEIQMSQDNGVVWTPLTPPDISVENLDFYISPASDPFADIPTTNQMPLVTIVLSTINIKAGATEAPTWLQTTISSRQYLR